MGREGWGGVGTLGTSEDPVHPEHVARITES